MRKILLFLGVLAAISSAAVERRRDFAEGPGGWNARVEDGMIRHVLTSHRPGSYLADTEPLAVEPGEVVAYAAEVRIPAALRQGVYRLQAVALRADGGVVQTFTSTENLAVAPEWTRLSMVFRVPKESAKLQLRLLHNGIGEVQVRRVDCYNPAPGSFEAGAVPAYAGTLEEKKILHDWSLKTGGSAAPLASLDYRDRPAEERYSVNFHWTNRSGTEKIGTIESAVEDSRPAPAPLREVEAVELQLKVTHRRGDQRLRIRLCERLSGFSSYQNQWFAEIPLEGAKEWRKVVIPASAFRPVAGKWGNPDWKHVDTLMFFLELQGKGELNFKLAGTAIRYADGSTGHPFRAWSDPYWYFLNSAPAPMLPELKHRNVHGSGVYCLETEKGRRNFLELQKLVPNLAFQQYTCLRELLRAREWLRAHNMTAAYQGVGPFLWQKAVELDALAVDLDSYELLNERHHKMDYTSPAWREIWQAVAARFANYGLPEYQSIDSNFRVRPEKIDRNAPAILNGEDHGIAYFGGRTLRFWDYFEMYAGFRWSPADLGYRSWSEHKVTPSNFYTTAKADPQQVKRGYLDMVLRHYAFARWHADAAGAFRRHGVRYFLMNNGDDWRNGNDWIANVRSANLGGFVEETYFYHPNTVLKAFHLARAMRKVYGETGVHHRLIAESGKGGHAPIYWAPEFSYAAIFDIAASTPYDSLEMDWPSALMEDQRKPENRYDYDRFRDYLAKSLAYNHTAPGETITPNPDLNRVFSLQETTALYAGPRQRKLSIAAEQENWPVSRLTPELFDAKEQKKAKLVINDCYALSARSVKTLAEWVDGAPGRVLVLHGAAAGRRIDGTMWSEVFGWDPVAMNAPEQFAGLVGRLEFRDGRTWTGAPGKVVFKDADGPALTCFERPSGSVVWFYHHTPGLDRARDGRIVGYLMKRHGIRPVAETGGELYVRDYRHADGMLTRTLFARPELDRYQWIYSATDNGLYPWRIPGTVRRGTVFAPPGRYTLYGMLSGKEAEVEAGADGRIPVELDGISADVIHLVPAGNEKRLEQLRKRRHELFRFPERGPSR